jgi:SAM-dependent methyltransferase
MSSWKDFVRPDLRVDELLGVPFLARDPQQYRVALTFDAYSLLFSLKSLLRDLDEQIKSPKLMRLTRDRLKAFRAANQEHFTILEKHLRPLGHQTLPFSEFNDALQTKRAGFSLMQYYDHLFRDWDWGTAEVDASVALASQLLPPPGDSQSALFLGAGACRFPYELHRQRRPGFSLCVDLNPFLLSCAQRLTRGEALELYEFPTVPVDLPSFARRAKLSSPEAVPSGLEFLVHNLDEWGFREGVFDLVVTHWVIDAIPMSPQRLFALINRALKPGGTWLNIGPVGFNRRTLSQYYSREEVLALVEKASLQVLAQSWTAQPYFHNPSSSHWRTEHVLSFAAKKTGEAAAPEERDPVELPEWLDDPTQPIELPADLAELSRSYAFCLDLLKRLEKRPSLQVLAPEMAQAHGLTPEQAEYAVGNTLMQWVDASRHNPMKSRS